MKNIDAKTAQTWLELNQAIIVDVREPDEHAAMHIKGATLIPLASVTKEALPPLEDRKLIMHCHFGKRSSMACRHLLEAHPELDVYNLEGGIDAWIKAGLPVES